MILLSEVAEQLRNEVLSWHSSSPRTFGVQVGSGTDDTRLGNPLQLVEFLLVSTGLLIPDNGAMKLEIAGTGDTVVFNFHGPKKESFHPSSTILAAVEDKTRQWNGQVSTSETENLLSVTLHLPVETARHPVDLYTMAKESGISVEEAREIFVALTPTARNNVRILKEERRNEGDSRHFRAAHSLKGSARTLRAPELAAAARVLEMEARDGRISNLSITRLDKAWKRLETWMNTNITNSRRGDAQ